MMNRHIKTFIVMIMLLTGCDSKSADADETNVNSNKYVPLTIQKTEVYIREYSEEHLKNNPSQKIQKIVLHIDHRGTPNDKEDAYSNELNIFVKRIDLPTWYQLEAGCSKNDMTNKYLCEWGGYPEYGTYTINDLSQMILSEVKVELDKCTTVPYNKSLNHKTIRLIDVKGKPETFKLYLSDEANFKRILKGSNCEAPFRDGQENTEYL